MKFITVTVLPDGEKLRLNLSNIISWKRYQPFPDNPITTLISCVGLHNDVRVSELAEEIDTMVKNA